MAIPVTLPDDVRHAIREMIERRRSIGLISTGQMVRELRRSFTLAEHGSKDLENLIARDAIDQGMNVHFDTSNSS